MKVILDCELDEVPMAARVAQSAIANSSFSGGFAVYGRTESCDPKTMWIVKKNKNSYTVRRNMA